MILFPVFVDKTLPNFVLVTVETTNNEVIFKIACMQLYHYHIFVFECLKMYVTIFVLTSSSTKKSMHISTPIYFISVWWPP